MCVFSCSSVWVFLFERNTLEMDVIGEWFGAKFGLGGRERVSDNFEFPNLLKLDAERERKLKEQVERSDGKVRVAVHPGFHHETPEKGSLLYRVREGLKKVIRSEAENNLPLIVFVEGGGAYNALAADWKRQASKVQRDRTYFVPTHKSDPRPMLGYSGVSRWSFIGDEKIEVDYDWEPVMRILTKAGVRRCLVGGEYLLVSEVLGDFNRADQSDLLSQVAEQNGGKQDEYWVGCVGEVAARLAQRFTIESSNLSIPDGRLQIMGIRPSESYLTMARKPKKD
jgi:hypothetical protein